LPYNYYDLDSPRGRPPIGPPNPLQAKLEVGAVDDPLEEEADRVADRVMRMPAMSATGVHTGAATGSALRRKCAGCEEEDNLQRKAVGTSEAAAAAPPIVHEVLGSPGQPLDAATRAFMEPRFGHDFSGVRIHADAAANESARAVGARAYTVGHHVVVAADWHAPGTVEGDRLIAHELAHVLQNSERPERAEVRRYAEADTEVEEDDLELPGGVRYANPQNQSLDALMWRSWVSGHRDQDIEDAEKPLLAVDRGGAAPSFVERTGSGHQEAMGAHDGEVYSYGYDYKNSTFHAISALEFDVEHARTAGQLAAIYDSWFGAGFGGRLGNMTIPSNIDVRLQLMPYFLRAAKEKAAADPKIANSPLIRALNLTYVGTEAVASGPCDAQDIKGHLGGNTEHNDFATVVTGGNSNDFRITSPEGWACTTDGRDLRRPNVVWEVKVGHDWITDAAVASGSIDAPRLHTWMLSLESQRIECARAAARCGYDYRFAVDNRDVARALNLMWRGTPRVYCFDHAGGQCRF
jgi:hypothetical protein